MGPGQLPHLILGTRDELLEDLIREAGVELATAPSARARQEAATAQRWLVARRSAEQVRRMERARGLARA
jgi:hypothetical protein